MISVITTIAEPTECVKNLLKNITGTGGLIIIGDQKGPFEYEVPNTHFFPLKNQSALEFKITELLPVGHYARKNIGYLIAMQKNETCLYETDDDNAPNGSWQVRSDRVNACMAKPAEWINVYRHFSKENIWPRGFLLDRIGAAESAPVTDGKLTEVFAPIQQGLVDRSPDVDAIWRLTRDREFYFEPNDSIALPAGAWCPFNTQSTWWWKPAFPLMYLPSFCSFRMTDIWKSFIAQRCLWEMGHHLVFHGAEAVQDRNPHDLMRDFEAEIPGYTQNRKLTRILEDLDLVSGPDNVLSNLVRCYEALVKEEIFPDKEMVIVRAWAQDVEKLLY